jgi:hypothetical protein
MPVTTIVGFCFLLTWIFILYQPSPGPGLIQRMGWQAWESVDEALPPSKGSDDITIPSDPSDSSDVDWWNVTATEDNTDYASFPLDIWNPLLPHNTGCELLQTTVKKSG